MPKIKVHLQVLVCIYSDCHDINIFLHNNYGQKNSVLIVYVQNVET